MRPDGHYQFEAEGYPQNDRRKYMNLILLSLILFSFQALPVSTWSGSFYAPYEYGGTGTENARIQTSASATSGTCQVMIYQLFLPNAYNVFTDAIAWVGSDTNIEQDFTATWYISSTWILTTASLAAQSTFPLFRIIHHEFEISKRFNRTLRRTK